MASLRNFRSIYATLENYNHHFSRISGATSILTSSNNVVRSWTTHNSRYLCHHSRNITKDDENQERGHGHQEHGKKFFKSRGAFGVASILIGGSILALKSDERSPTLWRFLSLPVVNAAKSFPSDPPTGGGGKGPPSSRSSQFNFIADVVETVAGAVVSIEVRDHSALDWFGGVGGSQKTTSSGSGFIVTNDGLILTNAHVVAGLHKTTFSVRLTDGRVFAGKVEDLDTHSDLALLKINANNLPTIPLGDSAKIRPGEFVVALGSPLSLSNTVTSGIISSVARDSVELGIGNNISYIQTDASITFGNSGGPLVNLDGEVVGINSMKVSPGISFAIPINYVKGFLQRAQQRMKLGKQKPVRRYIGVTTITLTNDLYEEMERRGSTPMVAEGVVVLKVVVGSPAYLAGLKPGDIITSVNGKKVANVSDIYEAVDAYESLRATVVRGPKTFTFIIKPECVYLS